VLIVLADLSTKWSFQGYVNDLRLVKLMLMLPLLQCLVAKDLIKVLDDGNATVLPAWDPMVRLSCSSIRSRRLSLVNLHRARSRDSIEAP